MLQDVFPVFGLAGPPLCLMERAKSRVATLSSDLSLGHAEVRAHGHDHLDVVDWELLSDHLVVPRFFQERKISLHLLVGVLTRFICKR